jgi:hypothetical protein
MWHWLVVMSVLCTGVADAQQEKGEYQFPPQDRIQLLLTQSERAFDTYEQVMEQEKQAGGNLAKPLPRDREVLTRARDLIASLKKSPDGFNGPPGFLLVGDLADGSRNTSLCMGQAAMQSGVEALAGSVPGGKQYQHLAQACLDASALLSTVSETAFNMYGEYLLAEDGMTKRAMASLEQCVDVLKKNRKQ